MKKLFFLVFVIGCFYFALPTPALKLTVKGYQSHEPGDTGQVANIVAAYYTNQSQTEIIKMAKKSFDKTTISKSKNLFLLLPSYILVHPPEYAKTVIRKTHRSWHFVELVHWGRESLFISFWEPALYNKSARVKKGHDYLLANQQKWQRKVTFYYLKSSWLSREIIWTLTFIGFLILIRSCYFVYRFLRLRKK